MAFFKYIVAADVARPISAKEADKAKGDAGITYRDFIVQAERHSAALDGARRWVSCWKDEKQTSVPDNLMLEERKNYMTLRVL